MEIVKLHQLKKKYGSTSVLKGIDLTIHKGEVFGFVGHNGAGKSTFIHILTGIIRKTAGSFEILGVKDTELDQVKKEMGVMPDISNLYEHMKGLQFLMYMGELVGDDRSKKEYLELMHDVGLVEAGSKKIKTYSFGMKKKISIAQALLGNPKLIVLDEPTSGLDPESAIQIRRLVTALQRNGKTIILTSHNLDEIDKICNRVGILSDGVIKKLGTPQELKTESEPDLRILVRTEPILTNDTVKALSKMVELGVKFIETRGSHTLLEIMRDQDIPVLSKELIESDIDLFEIKIDEHSLEEVFMNTK